MLTDDKLEEHYSSIQSETLHALRDEYKWALDECGIHNDSQLRAIEKILVMRGESLTARLNRRILFLCKCGQSRIVTTNVPDDKIKMFIFDQYNVPCTKCRSINSYTWKYMD